LKIRVRKANCRSVFRTDVVADADGGSRANNHAVQTDAAPSGINTRLLESRRMPKTVRLERFNISKIKPTNVVVMVGRRESGKSWLIRDILYYNRDIPIGTVICPTERVAPFFHSMIPSPLIHSKFHPSVIQNVMRRQRLVLDRYNRDMQASGASEVDPRAFLIMDDCLASSQKWKHNEEMRELLMNGRHLRLMYLLTMQYPLGIPPELRTQIDYVFVMNEPYRSNRKRIWENYAGMFPSFDMFCSVMDQCTADFNCVVLHTNCKSSRLEDQVFWYKASDHGPFRIGSALLWDCLQDPYYSQDMEDAEEDAEEDVAHSKGSVVVRRV
jgi:hypothetical protein